MKTWFNAFKGGCVAAAFAALLPLAAQAQVALDWAVATPSTYGDMIALDRDDNAYVAGSDPLALTMLISKVSATGTVLWRRTFDNPGTSEQSSWITVDADGNAIVTGYTVRASDGSAHGLIVLKFDPAGNLLWQDVAPSPYAYALRVTTDAANNVYVLGRAWLTNASGNTTLDIVTIKYNASGTRLWLRSLGFDNWSADAPTSIALTPAGQVIVTGGRVAAAYDAAGNTLWSKVFETSSAAIDVAVGASGAFYIVGGTYSATTGNTFLVHKFDANFNPLWRKTYGVGPWAWRVAVDSKDNAIVAGITGTDWMTIKLDPNGALLWSRRYDEHRYNDEIPYSIAIGLDDTVYVTGQGGPGPTSGYLSYLRTVTVKYAPDGTQVWAATTFDSVRGLGVKLGSDNSVFVIGESPQTVFHYQQTGAVNQLPVAAASATPTSGQAPLYVTFSSAGSQDPDGTIIQYRWNFGDGSSALGATATHSYAAGTYTATLTVTDNVGGTTTSAPVTITADPTAPPPATPTSVALNPTVVRGGRNVTATVAVSSTAGVVLTLASSNPTVAAVPTSVRIPAGSTSASFTVQTSRVRTDTSVLISASANGTTRSATLTVIPR